MRPARVSLLGLLVLILGVAILVGMYQRLTTPKAVSSERTPPVAAPAVSVAKPTARTSSPRPERRPLELGLTVHDDRAWPGYTLLAPLTSSSTYLIDLEGRVVRAWKGDRTPALSAMLLEDGHLLRPGALVGAPHPLNGSGAGGQIQRYAWDGRLVWNFKVAREDRLPHHDATWLPNGHVLVIAWEAKTQAEALAAGRQGVVGGGGPLLPDCLLEIAPTGPTSGEVVWEWHAWDHLVQDVDPTRTNFGKVADHPELIDVNFGESPIPTITAQSRGMAQLRSLGYAGAPGPAAATRTSADWTHTNAVAYHPDLDQIMLTVHAFSEIWIIDHGTSSAEAAGHTGGRYGRGGDLLYRWGNPRTYRAGQLADQRLNFPHGAHWIPPGGPGEGHVLVFNNGPRRPGGPYSSVEEIVLPVDARGHYRLEPGAPAEPKEPAWSYAAPNKSDFYAMLLSGAQRLPNGNTLICSGMSGTVFEVTSEKDIVWQYTCPVPPDPSAATNRGMGPPGGSALFRAWRYGPDDPALAGKDLSPGKPLGEIAKPGDLP
jgi:hypothetical protein